MLVTGIALLSSIGVMVAPPQKVVGESVTLGWIQGLTQALESSSGPAQTAKLESGMDRWSDIRRYFGSLYTASCSAPAHREAIDNALKDWFRQLEIIASGPNEEKAQQVIRFLAKIDDSYLEETFWPSCVVSPERRPGGFAWTVLRGIALRHPDRMLKLLGDTDPQVVFATSNTLVLASEETSGPSRLPIQARLRLLLQSPNEGIRMVGIIELRRLLGDKAVDEIVHFFGDSSSLVREAAVEFAALDETGLKRYSRKLQSPSAAIRLSMLKAYGNCSGDWDSIFLSAVKDPDEQVRAYAVEMAAYDSFEKIPLAAWRSLLLSPIAHVRKVGVENLYRLGAGFQEIISYLGDPDRSVRAAAAYSLAKLKYAEFESVIASIGAECDDSMVISELARIVKSKEPGSAPLAVAMMRCASPALRSAAVSAVLEDCGNNSIGRFKEVVLNLALLDRSRDVRFSAVVALLRDPHPTGLPFLVQASHDTDLGVRANALVGLATLDTPIASAALEGFTGSDDEQTAELAKAAKESGIRLQELLRRARERSTSSEFFKPR